MKNTKKGFTLIELLVVIAIIGILSAIGLVALNGAREKARDAQRKSDLSQMKTALILYSDDNGSKFPTTVAGQGPPDKATYGAANAGVWFSGVATQKVSGAYLSTELKPPSSFSTYNYDANGPAATANSSTTYLLFTKLETGTKDHYYIMNDVGGVCEYDDAITAVPVCALGVCTVITGCA